MRPSQRGRRLFRADKLTKKRIREARRAFARAHEAVERCDAAQGTPEIAIAMAEASRAELEAVAADLAVTRAAEYEARLASRDPGARLTGWDRLTHNFAEGQRLHLFTSTCVANEHIESRERAFVFVTGINAHLRHGTPKA